MKKIYIPTDEELHEMQEMTKKNGLYNGSIIYKYLLYINDIIIYDYVLIYL